MERLLHRQAHGPDLTSVTAKLLRSWDHFDALSGTVSSWMNQGLYRLVRETNADFTEHRLLYRCPKELNFQTLSLIFGDAIHNLRSALDHLVYSIAIHKSSQPPPPPDWDKIAFPITTSPEAFKTFCKSKLKSFAGDIKLNSALERIQPYNRRHREFPPLLRLLKESDDADKHRLLHLAVIQGTQWEHTGTFGDIPSEAHPGFIPHDGELKDGSKVVTIITRCPAPNLDFNGFKLELGLIVKHAFGPTGINQSRLDVAYRAIELEVATVIDAVLAALE